MSSVYFSCFWGTTAQQNKTVTHQAGCSLRRHQKHWPLWEVQPWVCRAWALPAGLKIILGHCSQSRRWRLSHLIKCVDQSCKPLTFLRVQRKWRRFPGLQASKTRDMGEHLVWQYNICTTFLCLHSLAWKRSRSTNSAVSGWSGLSMWR